MSLITDVVVVGYVPTEIAARLTEPVPGDERRQHLEEIGMGGAGGTKVFTIEVFAAAFNYLGSEFLDWIGSLDWPDLGGSEPVLWMQTENDPARVYRLTADGAVPLERSDGVQLVRSWGGDHDWKRSDSPPE